MQADLSCAVRVEGLTHIYGANTALDDVSIEVGRGTTTALIGPDGVGKSTLLGLIAGIRRLQGGRIQVLGGDIASARYRNAVSSRIAYMPQGLGRNLYPTLSVYENLDFAARLFALDARERRMRIAQLLAATGLDPFPDRPAGKLSGGMRQKLSLCVALVHDPDLLILDEPTTGIDPLARRQFWTLIDSIRAERPQMTTIVATAYMEEAERFEHLVAMDAGRVLAADSVRAMLGRTGAKRLEEAYISLRSHGRGGSQSSLVLLPRVVRDGPTAIRAEGLTRRFGDFTAVDNVSFAIERGEIFGFLGSNGCGKTTTMKMLTGLLPASAGCAEVLGRSVEAHDVQTRLNVGYMSQSFSLYEEITIRANLALHARLYRIDPAILSGRVDEAMMRFDLTAVADRLPSQLPLGIRQRLQLAAACLHKPAILILDEPTSGVDPAARDAFWRTLGELSRGDGVTIFISTHFMNEAERCDRISLMHAGKVLAVGTPAELVERKNAQDLDDAFVAFIADEMGSPPEAKGEPSKAPRPLQTASLPNERSDRRVAASGWLRTWAFALREGLELMRDPVRLSFAFFGPLILLLNFGYGINFDVDELSFAVLDQDRSAESRRFVESFTTSRYFREQRPILRDPDIDRRLQSGELRFVISIPPGFGRDLVAGRGPVVGFLLDGANTHRAETSRGYIHGVMQVHARETALSAVVRSSGRVPAPLRIEPRFRYNQSFSSVFAILPGSIMLIVALIPPMLASLGVVREREIGSITNLYASPATIGEFFVGKQIPYVVVGFVSYLTMVMLAILHFGLVIKGSLLALLLGGLLYVFAMTAIGLLVSSFTRTQIAALIATAVICVVPAVSFSGYLYPAASLEGAGRIMGYGFPAYWFQNISVGVFAKGLPIGAFAVDFIVLLGFGLGLLLTARAVTAKQEA